MSATAGEALTYPEVQERLLNLLTTAYDLDDPNIPWDERCVMVGGLAAVKDLAGQLMDRILTTLREDLPEWEMTMDGVGTFTKTNGTKRKTWDHTRVASVVAARAADDAVDLESGQYLPPAVFAQRIADELLACAGLSYWRAGELRKRHLSADDYCEKSEGTPTVIFKAHKPDA